MFLSCVCVCVSYVCLCEMADVVVFLFKRRVCWELKVV